MKFTSTILSLSVVAALSLAGCMTQEEPAPSTASQASFVRALGSNSANAAKISTSPGFDAKEAAKQMRAFGCPKLADLFEDYNAPTQSGELPKSFKAVISCFDIGDLTDLEARDSLQVKFENFTGILDCICGGTALTDALNGAGGGKLSAFSAATSNAATTSFNSSKSSGGTDFDASSSTHGTGFSSSGSFGTP